MITFDDKTKDFLILVRGYKGSGELFLADGTHFCYTLENPYYIIPPGTYDLSIRYSPKFKKKLPYLVNVPNRSGILIHVGNYITNSRGCILVGLRVIYNDRLRSSTLIRSKDAVRLLMNYLSVNPNVKRIKIIES